MRTWRRPPITHAHVRPYVCIHAHTQREEEDEEEEEDDEEEEEEEEEEVACKPIWGAVAPMLTKSRKAGALTGRPVDAFSALLTPLSPTLPYPTLPRYSTYSTLPYPTLP
jgi:hypothetical protein